MLEITIETAELEKQFTSMIEKIDHFKRVDIGNELPDWQVQDMHRNRPFTMRSRARGRAVTKIRPHSLYEVERSAKARGRVIARLRRQARRAGQYFVAPTQVIRRWSSRPYLRRSLLDVLIDRLRRCFEDKIKWQ